MPFRIFFFLDIWSPVSYRLVCVSVSDWFADFWVIPRLWPHIWLRLFHYYLLCLVSLFGNPAWLCNILNLTTVFPPCLMTVFPLFYFLFSFSCNEKLKVLHNWIPFFLRKRILLYKILSVFLCISWFSTFMHIIWQTAVENTLIELYLCLTR